MLSILSSRKVNWLWSTSLILILFIGSIFYHSFDRGFYKYMYHQLETAHSMEITDNELETATGVLLDYITDKRDNLDYELSSHDQMFNQKEIDHMVDVKGLFLASKSILIVSILIALFFTILFSLEGVKKVHFIFSQSFKASFTVFGLLIVILGLFSVIDFDSFWTQFHHIFFSNDLWLLNPQTDRLIQMVPLQFFNQLVFRILMTILLGIILLALLALYNPKKAHPKLHIVLFEPEIPQNTGNIMRTAVATHATLHLIEPFGFVYDDKRVKRSGMDYIDQLEIIRHDDWNSFVSSVDGKMYFATRYGEKNHTEFDYTKTKDNLYLVFGKESSGLPLEILSSNLDDCMRIPMDERARTLNLSNSVAIVMYEVLRQLDFQDLSLVEIQKGSDWLRKHQ